RVFELGARGRGARSALGALTTSLTHGALAVLIFSCGDLAAPKFPPFAEEIAIDLEPPPPVPDTEQERPSRPLARAPLAVKNAVPPGPLKENSPGEPATASFLLEREPQEGEASQPDAPFVTGQASFYAGGMTRPGPTVAAAPGGIGQGNAANRAHPPPASVDYARPAWLHTNVIWDCGFPWEAEGDRINYAAVRIAVTVKPDG